MSDVACHSRGVHEFGNGGRQREQWLQNQLFTNWKGFLHNGEVSVKRLRWGA